MSVESKLAPTIEASERALPLLPTSIGMGLSGGGYRAAAFHLGALAYLDRVELRDKLKAVSTVSGGTFTGARYALSRAASTGFGDFFRAFYHDLATFDLLELGLERLGGEPPEIPSQRHDLIVSLAEVYAETFFASKDGGTHLLGEILEADIGIEEIAFNATEFRHGIAFRFQKSARGRIGNGLVSIRAEDAAKTRLADVVAASSCFPGGFEPLAFPNDFAWPGGAIPENVTRAVGGEPLALMDGGIYDNQGVDSLLLADERSAIDLDMFIISDVDQPSDDMYPFPTEWRSGGLSVGALNLAARLLMASCIVTAVLTTSKAWNAFRSASFTVWDLFEYVVPMVLASVTAYALWWTRRTLRRELNRIPRVGRAAWKHLRRLRVGQLLGMARLRVTSLYAMASSIFMARIRSLVYRRVYEDEHYAGRRVSNLIYDLLPPRPFFFEYDPAIPIPSRELGRVVEVAAGMPTTLWFDDDKPYQLPCLVAAGQATLCYNLMKHVARRFGKDASAYPEPVRTFWNRLCADWTAMVADPYALLKELSPGELPKP